MSAGRHSELLGFFCRWLLLAAAGALVVTAAAAAIRATVGVAEDVRSRLHVADGVTATRSAENHRALIIRGFVKPEPVQGERIVCYAGSDGGISLGHQRGGSFHLVLPPPEQGTRRLTVCGLPYGGTAFQALDRRIVGVPAGRRLMLLDARWAGEVLESAPDRWRRLLRRMRVNHEVALYHPGERSAIASAEPALRRAADLPLLYDPTADNPGRSLRQVTRGVRGTHLHENTTVVTDDPGLADLAVRLRYRASLIGPQPRRGRDRLSHFRSLDAFEVSLPDRPIESK